MALPPDRCEITLILWKRSVEKAKVVAAKRNLSLNLIVNTALEQWLERNPPPRRIVLRHLLPKTNGAHAPARGERSRDDATMRTRGPARVRA